MRDESWDDREQRERMIGSIGRTRTSARTPARPSDPPTLREALRVERPVTVAELRELAARTYARLVVSVYLNLTGDRLVRRPGVYLSVFNSMRHRELAARQDLVGRLPTRQRSGLITDLDEIEDVIADLDLEGTRSIVVFKSGEELNRVFRLPVRTADSLTIDPDPYVEPLEAMLEEQRPVLVVEVGKEESRFWGFHLGHLEKVESLESFVPTDTVDASRPGKVQRHRLAHLRWHLRSTARLADMLLSERGFDLLVLSGDEDVLAELERFLPDRVRARVLGRLRPSPRQDRDELRREIDRMLTERRRGTEEAALARLSDYEARGLLTSGLAGVLEMANRFLVSRLFLSARLAEPGYLCREHHFLSLHEGRCPFCDQELLPSENIVDELIEFARLHGVELTVVEERPELLDPYGGVAAVAYELQPA